MSTPWRARTRRHLPHALAAALLVAAAAVATAQGEASREPEGEETAAFAEFVTGVRIDAAERGISAATLDAVLPGIRLHRRAI
jgi:membrane-bound lytic murein transglycosylase B